ncbi:MAG: sugar ABC transporter substrate-binding protein [Candidatus Pelethousia sp.]|nr:sugar ABC transporter substrate-binding protein [Candidatus Pelethousia sp.]
MKKALALFLVLVLAFSLAACAGKNEPAAPAGDPAGSGAAGTSDKQLTFGVTVSFITGYYSAMIEGIQATADELGIKIVLLNAENDSTKQNQQMENLIAQQVDAIVCNPEDSTAIATSVQKAMDAGIPVVMVDRIVDGATPSKQIINNSYDLAYQLVEEFAASSDCENLSAPLKTIVMVGSMADSYAVNCLAAMRDAIAAHPDTFELVSEIPGEWNQDTALKGLQNTLSANDQIDLILTPSDMYLPCIQSALEQINRWQKIGENGHVMVLSMDGDSNGLQAIKDGYTEADAVIDAKICGQWGVEYAYKIVKGEETQDGATIDLPGFIVTYKNFAEKAPEAYSYDDLT